MPKNSGRCPCRGRLSMAQRFLASQIQRNQPHNQSRCRCWEFCKRLKSKNFPKNEKQKTTQPMNHDNQFEHRASSSRSMHVGESSYVLCDRPSRIRDFSQRQLPTDQDYAVSTREYQTDRSSLKSAPTAARPVLGKRPMQRQRQKQKQPHSFAGIDRVTPYQTC